MELDFEKFRESKSDFKGSTKTNFQNFEASILRSFLVY